MRKVTTHVLDLSNGVPAKHVHIKLYSINLGEREEYLQEAWTNDDGRVDEPLLQGEQLKEGVFELEFHVGDYFNEQSSMKRCRSVLKLPTQMSITTCRY
ncbi:5-hydroxyisourate hydrolase [Geomicrobium sp. JCM 19038]|nr:5-hydroxyisourate hydrolase [Geomicrobium sp. JCM 19038]